MLHPGAAGDACGPNLGASLRVAHGSQRATTKDENEYEMA